MNKDGKSPILSIIGCYPPPYGGISVHLERLTKYLDIYKYNYILYNTDSKSQFSPNVKSVKKIKYLWFFIFCIFTKSKVVHLMTVNWFSRLYFVFIMKFKPNSKSIISVHGDSISSNLSSSNPIRRYLTQWILKNTDHIITSNRKILYECNDIGIKNNISHIPAFIPPIDNPNSIIPATIEDYIKSHDPIISIVGWIGIKYNNEDLYGIDLLISMVKKIKNEYPNVGVLFSVNGGDREIINSTKEKTYKDVGNSILFITEKIEDITFIYKNSLMFLRLTNTDGDSVSIREALYYNTPVIASDIIERPKDCILFENRNHISLTSKVREVLSNYDEEVQKITSNTQISNAKAILDLYNSLEE